MRVIDHTALVEPGLQEPGNKPIGPVKLHSEFADIAQVFLANQTTVTTLGRKPKALTRSGFTESRGGLLLSSKSDYVKWNPSHNWRLNGGTFGIVFINLDPSTFERYGFTDSYNLYCGGSALWKLFFGNASATLAPSALVNKLCVIAFTRMGGGGYSETGAYAMKLGSQIFTGTSDMALGDVTLTSIGIGDLGGDAADGIYNMAFFDDKLWPDSKLLDWVTDPYQFFMPIG